jgi:hypothetical protein
MPKYQLAFNSRTLRSQKLKRKKEKINQKPHPRLSLNSPLCPLLAATLVSH